MIDEGMSIVSPRSPIHSKPVPLWEVLSIGLSACAHQWAQFRVGLLAWGMESWKESLVIKKFTPAVITAKFKKTRLLLLLAH